jgi:ATP-dependent helicase HepA
MVASSLRFVPGQRWVSDSEPELGLGSVLETGFRDVKIHFPAAGETRLYMQRNAPLRRAQLRVGDRARGRDGQMFLIRTVKESGGLLTYYGEKEELPEQELLDRISFSDPDKRLLAGQLSKPRAFSLRLRTQEFRHQMLGSNVRGLAGARMQLLPHQLSIAYEVAARRRPRVLLADEVGLGKTIEAGLIFHRLYVTGQVSRVLIVTPSQLVHQWLVEMYRRFNHMFTVLDEEMCRAEEKGDTSKNPFAQRQTILCAIDFLTASPRRVEQALAAGIDLLIVDEAHHLQWTPEKASPEYAMVEKLAQAAKGVLLLTATPIQLGQAGHFARLRLLDPERFSDLDTYLQQTRHYEEIAALVNRLLASEAPQSAVADGLLKMFPGDVSLHVRIADYLARKPDARQKLVDDLVDRHGTGRMMFRNRRQALGGFPRRVVHAVPLTPDADHLELAKALFPDPSQAFQKEAELARFLNGAAEYTQVDLKNFTGDGSEFLRRAWKRDPRLLWLVEFLKENPGEKVLLLCAHKAVVFALQEILPTLTAATFASFHENLTMATRDRNAAYFSEKDGAQMLICSEIGSEGRNFQFAHHLVLFDLPLDPSVLEQRIGRLDRIGQTSDIHLHIPYLRGTVHEVVFQWYHEGIDAFRDTVLGADYFHEALIGRLLETCRSVLSDEVEGTRFSEPKVAELIQETEELVLSVRETLEKGRDRLLEINSNKSDLASGLIAGIHAEDEDAALEQYLGDVFDHYGLEVQETTVKRGYFVFPGERLWIDSFPGISESGLALSYDRDEVLVREDQTFLSIDHPLVRGVVDLLLEGDEGSVGFAEWRDAPMRGMALEAVFLLEATAPGALHLDRFLPPTPLRVLVDEKGESLNHLLPRLDAVKLDMAPAMLLEEQHELFEDLVPKLLEAARAQAAFKEAVAKKAAHQEAEKRLLSERDRLRDLQRFNPAISDSEVLEAGRHAEEVLRHIAQAELRLDAVRLILMGKMRD